MNDNGISIGRVFMYLGIGFLVLVVALMLAFSLGMLDAHLNFLFGWKTKPLEIFNADRVQEVRTGFVERANALEIQLAQVQSLDTRIATIVSRNNGKANWPIQDKADYESFVQSRLDMVSNYNRLCGQYNADWENEYKSVVAEDLKESLPVHCQLYEG